MGAAIYQGTSCTGATTASGSPIDTKPGKHSFVVEVSSSPTNKALPVAVTYTVTG